MGTFHASAVEKMICRYHMILVLYPMCYIVTLVSVELCLLVGISSCSHSYFFDIVMYIPGRFVVNIFYSAYTYGII